MAFVGIGMIAFAIGFPDCAREKAHRRENAMLPKTIQEVLKIHTPDLMSIPGVVGTALGEFKGKPCIKIFVIKKTEELMKKIPSTLEGFPVDIKQTGEIRALDAP